MDDFDIVASPFTFAESGDEDESWMDAFADVFEDMNEDMDFDMNRFELSSCVCLMDGHLFVWRVPESEFLRVYVFSLADFDGLDRLYAEIEDEDEKSRLQGRIRRRMEARERARKEGISLQEMRERIGSFFSVLCNWRS